jgi:uncharacterized protein (DUF362 family)
MAAATGRSTSKVAVLHTSPETVLDDYQRLMKLADYESYLPDKSLPTILKINISWQYWYPACSTTPWQLDGVIQALRAGRYNNLAATQNATVVVDAHVGEENNKHKPVLDRHGIQTVHLYEPPVKWIRYEPKQPFLVLDKVYPQGVYIPDYLVGKNVVHLPTMKTHVFTTMTGAMKNAFGGLLNFHRHWTHRVIHETLCDLLLIQRDLHPGLFCVMDGTFAGEGPGPRAMEWHVKNLLIASGDPVAMDAVAAKIMGFDPLSLKFIRVAHEHGLGCGDVRQLDIVGEDIDKLNWRFKTGDTFASWGQKQIYWGPLHPFEWLLLRTPLVPWSYAASNIYHNSYWYRFKGKARATKALETTEWGKLFKTY